ncbi:restriction endonuclease subunit S [Cuspidothrix issatschenkoi LEGE 03284]|uniref:restriction endonuclease subunit S n=1 Tax=Cuspidothrix issatschenkoi TaxID=230752 RepID=UPI00187F28CB|nr:restriction endonuclease subunit S [Cuspidothrix issatschenkoi]MBE9230450.1 restriction endonuclease subunit S [Cuspidothrix issatschenkoi LEGE 03284]
MKWLSVKLSDIAVINMGQSPPGNSYNEDGKGIPLFQGKAEFGDMHPTPVKWCSEPTRIAEPDDILMSVRAPVGPTNIADQLCCIGRGLCAIRGNKKLTVQKYLYFLFKHIEPFISSQGQGSTFQSINRSTLESINIPLPPLSEQRRIVEILDQADALRKMRAEADAKSDRILPALFIKMFGDPSTWADGKTEPLGSLVNIQSGGTPSKKNPDYWDGDIPWVSPKDMKQDIIFDSIDHISQTAIEETNIKYVEPGAILIVVRGMILAHTIPIALAATRLTINQDMKALYPNCNDIDSTYLHAALKASSRKILSQVGTAGHGTRKFDTDELLKLPILIPSQEQLKKFQIAVTECRVSLAGISKTKKKLETLFNVLLQRAFSGELTAKWREAHIKELLAEMEEQAKILNLRDNGDYQQLSML